MPPVTTPKNGFQKSLDLKNSFMLLGFVEVLQLFSIYIRIYLFK